MRARGYSRISWHRQPTDSVPLGAFKRTACACTGARGDGRARATQRRAISQRFAYGGTAWTSRTRDGGIRLSPAGALRWNPASPERLICMRSLERTLQPYQGHLRLISGCGLPEVRPRPQSPCILLVGVLSIANAQGGSYLEGMRRGTDGTAFRRCGRNGHGVDTAPSVAATCVSSRHGGTGGTAHRPAALDSASRRGTSVCAYQSPTPASHRPGEHAEKALVAHADPTTRPLDGPRGPNDTGALSRPRHARLSLEWGHSPVRNAYRDILLFLHSFGDATQHDPIPPRCGCAVSEVLYRAAVQSRYRCAGITSAC